MLHTLVPLRRLNLSLSVMVVKKLKKGGTLKDACYYKVKSRYKVWPSAYASGALAKCRKVGAKNWGNNGGKKD